MRFLQLMLCGILCVSAHFSLSAETTAEDSPAAKAKQLAAQAAELKEDISTINLLNGLRLTRQQSEAILELARQSKTAAGSVASGPHNPRNAFKARADFTINDPQNACDLLAKTVAAFAAFKAEDLKGEPPRGAVTKNAISAEHSIKDNKDIEQLLKQHHAARVTPPQAKNRLAELDGKLNKTLTDGQKEIVKTFKACLVPPAGLRDPVRAGQAATEWPIRKLKEFRSLSQEDWNARKAAWADKAADPHDKFGENQLVAEKQRLLDLVEKVRGMSDTDFELQKTDLAAQLKPAEKQAHQGKLSWAARWLLTPRVIPLLEARLKAETEPRS